MTCYQNEDEISIEINKLSIEELDQTLQNIEGAMEFLLGLILELECGEHRA